MSGKDIWTHPGGTTPYHAVTVHVAEGGAISASDDLDTYISPAALVTQGNMRKYTRDPETFDPLFPGVYPETMSKMVVNVKLDMMPQVRAGQRIVFSIRMYLTISLPLLTGNQLGPCHD